MKASHADTLETLKSKAVIFAALVAAREAAARHGTSLSAEVIEDEGSLSLVITPGEAAT